MPMRRLLDSCQAVLRDSTSFRKLLLCLCTFVLALQLTGAACHDHDLADQLSDCVSCQLAAHYPADVPATPPALLAVFLFVAYALARLPRPVRRSARRYFIPSPQAPPPAFSC